MNLKKIFGTLIGLALLAALSLHQVRNDHRVMGVEDLMTGTAIEPQRVDTPPDPCEPTDEGEGACEQLSVR